jgi:hypothetical protein
VKYLSPSKIIMKLTSCSTALLLACQVVVHAATSPFQTKDEGLTSRLLGFVMPNGMTLSNELQLPNGMVLPNGLTGFDGLATVSGETKVDGLEINCQGKSYPSKCTGMPDGVLSRLTGLMSNADGVIIASYVIRCALPSSSTIQVKNWNEELVSMSGEVGVAPEWEAGSCGQECQEKVSACLLALTNNSGAHVSVEMTAPWHSMGTNHELAVSEAVFYGNLFLNPPEAYMAAGRDYAKTLHQVSNSPDKTIVTENLMPRSCSALMAMTFTEFTANQAGCPIMLTGSTSAISWSGLSESERNKCTLTAVTPGITEEGTAKECSSPGLSGKTWNYPITTWSSNDWGLNTSSSKDSATEMSIPLLAGIVVAVLLSVSAAAALLIYHHHKSGAVWLKKADNIHLGEDDLEIVDMKKTLHEQDATDIGDTESEASLPQSSSSKFDEEDVVA